MQLSVFPEWGQPTFICPECGAAMIIAEILARKQLIRAFRYPTLPADAA